MKIKRADGTRAVTTEDAKAYLDQAFHIFQDIDIRFMALNQERDRALKALSEAQQAFDAAVNDLRAWAPLDSMWGIESKQMEGLSEKLDEIGRVADSELAKMEALNERLRAGNKKNSAP